MGPATNLIRSLTLKLNKLNRLRLARMLVFVQEILYHAYKSTRLPVYYKDYLHWFNEQMGHADREYVIFDLFSTPIYHYIAKDAIERWIQTYSLSETTVCWRNRNSWSLTGVKGQASADADMSPAEIA